MTADLLKLMDEAVALLDGDTDPVFIRATQDVVLILKSASALPFLRSTANGYQHSVLAAALVLTYQRGVDVMLSTRKAQTIYDRGYNTCLLGWFDRCVMAVALISNSPTGKAIGPLKLGPLIIDYLDGKGLKVA